VLETGRYGCMNLHYLVGEELTKTVRQTTTLSITVHSPMTAMKDFIKCQLLC